MQLPVHKYKLPVHELMFLSAQIKIDSAQKLHSVHKETGHDGGQVTIVLPRFTGGIDLCCVFSNRSVTFLLNSSLPVV